MDLLSFLAGCGAGMAGVMGLAWAIVRARRRGGPFG
jgi:hypothetical protein